MNVEDQARLGLHANQNWYATTQLEVTTAHVDMAIKTLKEDVWVMVDKA